MEISVKEVIAAAAAKNRANLAENFGTWLPEEGNTANSIKSWVEKRTALYQKWIANLKKLGDECDLITTNSIPTEKLLEIVQARQAAQSAE